VPLPWDSQHFEIPVARIISPELNDAELGDLLSYAKEKGYHLVYWGTCPERNVPLPLLRNFSGSLVDRKVTYQRKLSPECTIGRIEHLNSPFPVIEYPQLAANQQLLALALLGGGHSRFQVDPGISREKFESMYHIWINRSTLHEIADVVFVATDSSNLDEYLGVVTGSAKNGVGKVGLMGVQKEVRGQGIGSLLIQAVHSWMVSNDVNISEVVTQRDNIQACKFYERSGYIPASLQHYYHFWVHL
jgi:dTDP-4-amino-4,6-dideoxy-D-galactose acyltransferase